MLRNAMIGLAAAAVLVPAVPASAIRNDEPDTTHPSVGLIRFTHVGSDPRNDRAWAGTLIADRVMLTAARCVADTERPGFFVTFNPRLVNNPLVDPSVAGEYPSATPIADPRLDRRSQRRPSAALARVSEAARGARPPKG